MSLKRSIKQYFGEESFDWLDVSYVVDWIVVAAIWMLSWLVATGPVFERDFSLQDPLISHPHKENTVSSTTNHYTALLVPILIATVAGIFERNLIAIHHAALSVCAGRGLARFITVCIKHAVGRLRPDFLARCQWNAILQACEGKPVEIFKGRLSFPSGHSSTAFSGMTFISLWFAGRSAAWCFHLPMPANSLRSSRLGNFCLPLLPLIWATYVAISRMQDYRHHKEDIVVGSFIGIISATICYLILWPNPFSAKNLLSQTGPRVLYVQESGRRGRNNIEFELTELDDEEVGGV